MKFMKWMLWHESSDMNELKGMNWTEWTKRMNWNERIEINNSTWMTWNEWIDMNDLERMKWHEWVESRNWNEWIETNYLTEWMTWTNWHEKMKRANWKEWMETNELKWMNWNEWTEMNELKRMNWNEWNETNELKWMKWNHWIDMNELKWRNRSEWLDMNELKGMNWTEWTKRMNWNERIEINNLTWMNWHEWTEINELNGMKCQKVSDPLCFFTIFIWKGALATVSHAFCRPHRPKVVWDRQPFTLLCDQLLDDDVVDISNRALATVSCTFCRPHLQKVVRDRPSYDFYVTSSSCYSLVHILSASSSKSAKKTCQFFTIDALNRTLATVSCTFCQPLSGSRRETAATETLQRRPRTATLPEKNTGFCARECFQPWIHAFPIFHTSQLLDDDVIDMMMWLTWWLRWWCGCHDGETASHWQSSVTRKFPN